MTHIVTSQQAFRTMEDLESENLRLVEANDKLEHENKALKLEMTRWKPRKTNRPHARLSELGAHMSAHGRAAV